MQLIEAARRSRIRCFLRLPVARSEVPEPSSRHVLRRCASTVSLSPPALAERGRRTPACPQQRRSRARCAAARAPRHAGPLGAATARTGAARAERDPHARAGQAFDRLAVEAISLFALADERRSTPRPPEPSRVRFPRLISWRRRRGALVRSARPARTAASMNSVGTQVDTPSLVGVHAGPLGNRERLRVAPEAVEQDCARPFRRNKPQALAATHHLLTAGLDQHGHLVLRATPRSQGDRALRPSSCRWPRRPPPPP